MSEHSTKDQPTATAATAVPASFRAECDHDVDTVFEALTVEVRSAIAYTRTAQPSFPDVLVDLTAKSQADLDELVRVIGGVPDCHVILETFRQVPLCDNSLDRDQRMHASNPAPR